MKSGSPFSPLSKVFPILKGPTLVLLAAVLTTPTSATITLNLGDFPESFSNAGTFDSTGNEHPLRNPYKYWIGEINYEWLTTRLQQGNLSEIASDGIDGWDMQPTTGNYFEIRSYWEFPFSNSFSFTIPHDTSLQYSLVIINNKQTSITRWSEVVPIQTIYFTGGGTVLDSATSNANQTKFFLEPGGIYSVSQSAAGSGAGVSTYSIYFEAVPEPTSYPMIFGFLALMFAAVRRKRKA